MRPEEWTWIGGKKTLGIRKLIKSGPNEKPTHRNGTAAINAANAVIASFSSSLSEFSSSHPKYHRYIILHRCLIRHYCSSVQVIYQPASLSCHDTHLRQFTFSLAVCPQFVRRLIYRPWGKCYNIVTVLKDMSKLEIYYVLCNSMKRFKLSNTVYVLECLWNENGIFIPYTFYHVFSDTTAGEKGRHAK
jgi:hypothetical protein